MEDVVQQEDETPEREYEAAPEDELPFEIPRD